MEYFRPERRYKGVDEEDIEVVRLGVAIVVVVGIAAAVWVAASRGPLPGANVESPEVSVSEPVAGGSTSPVVVELFTSQGCSSCPPADRLLAGLESAPGYGERVHALSFHVDYWDRIGWKDPFSSPSWTERQYAYARALGCSGVYTPQAVVNGRVQFVGSDTASMRDAIAKVEAPAAAVTLEVVREGGAVRVRARATMLGSDDAAELAVVVVLAEREITTEVRRGENAGRALVNDHVVRRLETPFRIGGAAGRSGEGTVTFVPEAGWNAARLEVISFVQDPVSMRILGSASATVR